MTAWAEHVNCRLCRSMRGLERVLDLTPTPPANAFVRTPERQPVFPLYLAQCRECGHVQLPFVVDPVVLFRDYVYVSGTSPSFVRHFEEYAASLCGPLREGDLVVEVGSNDGTMLRCFQKRGYDVVGVDPAKEIAARATSEGILTLPCFFDAEAARMIKEAKRRRAKLVVANNVFAHADDLRGIAVAVRDMLEPNGRFVFEVQYLVDLVEKGLFDMCLPPGEVVMTDGGYTAIGDIQVGDRVLTHRGRFRKVTKVFRRSFTGDLCVIQPYGSDIPIRVTPEHPIYVRRGLGEFVAAKDIQPNDVVLKPAISESRKIPWLSIETPLAGHGKRTKVSKFRVGIDLMRVLGYYLAEGYYYSAAEKGGKNCAVAEFAFGKSEKEKRLAADCAARIRRLGGSATVRLTKFGWHVNSYGALARLLYRECGTGSENKHIPPWTYEIGPNLVEEMLRGYMLGDGYVYRKARYWRISTVSMKLAHGAALLANKIGWSCSVNKSKATWKPRTIAGNKNPTMAALPLIDILIRRETVKAIKVSFADGYQHGSVRSIAREAYAGEVCNLEVEEDHTYVTPAGAVHNCYHEHLSYHHVAPLVPFFHGLGMSLVHVDRVPTHGGSIRCHVVPLPDVHGDTSVSEAVLAERGALAPAELERFRFRIERARNEFRRFLDAERAAGRKVVGYGAPAKLTTLVHHFGVDPGEVACVVDDSAWKQGLYTPGKHIPVVRDLPTDTDTVVVFAWNFAEQIAQKLRAAGFRGKIINPLDATREIP